jgi:hypothetical protein
MSSGSGSWGDGIQEIAVVPGTPIQPSSRITTRQPPSPAIVPSPPAAEVSQQLLGNILERLGNMEAKLESLLRIVQGIRL